MWPALLPTLALLGAGVVVGWVNTLAGAGGLVAFPALLLAGLDAHTANGTLRVAILAQCLVGVTAFRRAGRLPLAPLRLILPLVVAGAAVGSWVATSLAVSTLTVIELVVLCVMAFSLLVRQSWLVPEHDEVPRTLSWATALGLLGTGFYGGVIQAGVGLLLVAVLCGGMRFDLVRGNAIKLAVTLAFNVVSLAIFLGAGQVEWRRGALLAGGSVVGALIAVRFAVRRGQEAIRWVIIIAVLAAVAVLVSRQLGS